MNPRPALTAAILSGFRIALLLLLCELSLPLSAPAQGPPNGPGHPQFAPLSGEAWLQWNGTAGQQYTVSRTSFLESHTWLELPFSIGGTGGVQQWMAFPLPQPLPPPLVIPPFIPLYPVSFTSVNGTPHTVASWRGHEYTGSNTGVIRRQGKQLWPGVARPHVLLWQCAPYRQAFIARLEQMLNPGGALAHRPGETTAGGIYAQEATNFSAGLHAELARWGDTIVSPAYTDVDWNLLVTSRTQITPGGNTGWMERRWPRVLDEWRAMPVITTALNGNSLEATLTAALGGSPLAIHYFTATGGAVPADPLISSGAQVLTSPVLLNPTVPTRIRARAKYAGNRWSGLVDETLQPPTP